jgi:hypothetical protein
MKLRDLGFMAIGATILIAGNVFVSTFMLKAEAQAAAATAGSYPMVVTQTPTQQNEEAWLSQSGVIAVNDQVHKRVTIVAYAYNIPSLGNNQTYAYMPPGCNLSLSTNQVFSY